MQRLILFHLNDLHARIEQLARAATVIEQERASHPDAAVLFFDAGDSEDNAFRLSNLTKGVALHRLLSVIGCQAAAVGNAALSRYGAEVLREQAEAARYPLLLANLKQPDGSQIPGTRPAALLEVRGGLCLGLIGVTADLPDIYERYFGLRAVDALSVIRELAAQLRQDGADAVIVLSHMGLAADRALADGLQRTVELIVGAHSHNLLPEGERVGDVMIAQAGQYGEHLGRVDVVWDGERLLIERASVLPLGEEIPPSPAVLTEIEAIERDAEAFLAVVIGELAEPLDFAEDRECGVGDLTADMLRERMGAEIGLVTAGQAFASGLPSGPLSRLALWDVCNSPANPGVVTMTGTQLVALVRRGLDPEFAQDRPRPMRGQARGLMHLSGGEVRGGRLLVGSMPIEAERTYRVAATDWELDTYGGYAEDAWGLQPRYDMPTIVREALEEYLAAHRPLRVALGRVDGSLLDF